MADFQRDDFDLDLNNIDDIEITPELLANFSTGCDDSFADSYSDTLFDDDEPEEKTIEQIREERYRRQEQRKLDKQNARRSAFVNYCMPALALVLLVSTVCYMNSLKFGLVVSYNNEQLGVVENAEVVQEATRIIDSRIINKSLDSLEDEPQYRVAVIKNDSELQNSTELSRSIIAKDTSLEDELWGVFADDDFIGSVSTEEEAQAVLSGLLEAKKKEAASLGTVQKVEFNTSVRAEVGLYSADSVIDKAELKNRLTNNVDISYKITVLEEQNVKIRYKTEYKVDPNAAPGYEKVTTKGVLGEGIATNKSVYIDGEKISSEHTKVVATKKPVNEVITVSSDNEHADTSTDVKTDNTEKASDTDKLEADADKAESKTENVADNTADNTANTNTNNESSTQPVQQEPKQFIWPAPGCWEVTGYFGYDTEEHLHKGLDISGPAAYGSPVAASAAGTVTAVVFDYGTEGLGCYVTIDHGNGYQTTYAQCREIYVAYGQHVEQGATSAAIGSTGDSTGPHLHFRIIENGVFVDPANFLY